MRYFTGRLHDSMTGNRFRNFCALVDVGGVDINAMDDKGQTPLILGCYIPSMSSGLSMVRKLIQSGADINKADPTGKSIIHHAVLRNHVQILKFLLGIRTVKLNLQDKDGNTALHLAVQAQDTKFIHLLVNHMAVYRINSEYRNHAGLTPLTLACKLGRLDIARYLSKVGNHSPMNVDPRTQRDGRMWLDSILFIPYELDPFNCPETELIGIQPRPQDYIPDDCKQNHVNYKWHEVVIPKVMTNFSRPKSAPDRFMIASKSSNMSAIYRLPPGRNSIHSASYYSAYSPEPQQNDVSFLTLGRESPTAFLKKRAYSAHSRSYRHKSCKEILPHLLALRASSDGIYPPAVPLPEEEKTPSELEAMEAEELMDSLSHSKNQEALHIALSGKTERAKKSEKQQSKLKQKVGHVQDALAATSTLSKMTRRAERKISKVSMA